MGESHYDDSRVPQGPDVESTATPIRTHGAVVGAVVLFRDISAHKRAGQEMQRADRLALVGQLASGLAHESRRSLIPRGANPPQIVSAYLWIAVRPAKRERAKSVGRHVAPCYVGR